ncbi:MAG: ATP-binding protein [Chloroflexi bacterium]|nr:ATP-binding protein [Chloroflexota bacterium]
MIRRALVVGLVGGILLSLAGLYPVVSLLAPLVSPMWVRPVANELAHGLLLMVSAAIGFPVLFSLGSLAAKRGEAQGWLPGAKAGLIAGLVASLIVYTTLVSPINALFAFGELVQFLMRMPESHNLPTAVLYRYIAIFENGNYLIEITFAIGLLLTGAQGAWMGWRRRHEDKPPRPSLYAHIANGRHPRRWFHGDETASRAGLIVGFVGSLVAMFAAFSWFYVGFITEWPELAAAMQHSHIGIVVSGPLRQAGSVLSPFILVGSLFYGALVVWLIKDPPNLLVARVRGVLLASLFIVGATFAIGLRVLYFNMGLLPFWLAQAVQQDPALMTDAAMTFQGMMELAQRPSALIALVLVTPWLVMVLGTVAATIIGLLQGLVYGFFIPLVHPRPVDKAARWWGRLRREPNDALRLIYALFNEEKEAYQILPHLAVAAYRQMPGAARLAAAYHTLGTSTTEAEQTPVIAAIQEILAAEPNWRWSADFQSVFASLSQILAAKSLDDILQIKSPMAEQQTSSLPPLLVQSVQRLSRVVDELHKVTMVDDLATKLIFLENALTVIHAAQRFVEQQLHNSAAAVSPEFTALNTTLDHWQGIVLEAIKRLKGRADVSADLQTRQSPLAAQIPLIYCVANSGLNVAQQVRVKLLPGEDYHLGDENESWIEILPPGERRQVNLTVLPQDGRRRLRIAWQVTYDDAVDAERSLTFADVVEFAQPDTPFQRIFPIPYVTGTPLKTDDVFVGREDVFAFIRENLLGRHQNNVIVLHGQRRTGKTSVLYRLGQMMADSHIAVLIDMQGKPARGEADFLFSIADDITFALEDRGLDIEPPRREDFAESPEFFFGSRFLRGLRPHLGDKNLLLMFDEFEEMQRRVDDGRLQPEILQFLRNLMQHEDRVDFVFSGTHKLEELGAEYWSILFNIASYKPITFLSAADMRRLIEEPVAAYNLEYDPLAVERMIKVTAGHPYFAQLVLHEMVVYHNETQRSYLTVMDVDRGLERIVGRGEAHFKFIWAESSPEARTVLQAVSELLIGQETVHVKDLRAFLARQGYQSADDWQQALTDLEGRDILTRQSAKSPLYRFKVDLIRLWIDRTRPSL